MCDISEDCWCAGWLRDLEFTLWKAVTIGKTDFGFGIRESDLIRLKHLHEMAGGWWIWEEGAEGNRFVTTEQWLTIFAVHRDPVPKTEAGSQADEDSPR
jgi:hypothetical protein